jgi:hypothetical protein
LFHVLGYFVTYNTTDQVHLTNDLAVGGASEDGLFWALFGEVTGDFTVFGEADEHVDVFFLFVGDGATCSGENVDAKSIATLLLGFIPDIAESLLIIINVFCFSDGFSEEGGGQHCVLSTRCLMGHDEAINSIQSGGGNLCQLCSLRQFLGDQGLKQLRLHKNGFR